ncbi:UNVERIFIED_CONTAM: hypothetical protein GTU68_062558 [Idotea baltica]|nr:hypothetical protein [Idotea baltica]
MGEILQRD